MGLWNAIKSLFGSKPDEKQQSKGTQQGDTPLSPHDESLPQNKDKEVEKRVMQEYQEQHDNDSQAQGKIPTIVPPTKNSPPTAAPTAEQAKPGVQQQTQPPAAQNSTGAAQPPQASQSQPPKFPSGSGAEKPGSNDANKTTDQDNSSPQNNDDEPPKPKSGMSGAI